MKEKEKDAECRAEFEALLRENSATMEAVVQACRLEPVMQGIKYDALGQRVLNAIHATNKAIATLASARSRPTVPAGEAECLTAEQVDLARTAFLQNLHKHPLAMACPFDAMKAALEAASGRTRVVAAGQEFTTGHCENRKRPGGCQLHNLQCGYPECDRRKV